MARRTAKTLSVVLMVVAAMTAVVVTGWFVHAQDGQQPAGEGQLSTPQGHPAGRVYDIAAMSSDSLRAEANRLREAGDFASALPLFEEECRRDPTGKGIAVLTGTCLDNLGRYQEAVQYYQRAMDEKKPEIRATALYFTAISYKKMGDRDKALESLKLQRECAPMSKWTIKGAGLKAELDGKSQAEIDQVIRREQEAVQLYHQAKDVVKGTSNKNPERLKLFDEILTKYPETGAAYEALIRKAENLWRLGKREEMCKCYDLLRPMLAQQQPPKVGRRLLRTMDSRVAQHRCEQQHVRIVAALAHGQPVSQQDWDQLYALWQQWRRNADPETAVEADVYRLFFLHTQGDFSTLVDKGREFFAGYFESNPDRMLEPYYKNFASGAHFEMGTALAVLKRYDEAIGHFRAIIEMATTTPPLGNEEVIVPEAYGDLCRTMKKAGAPRADVVREIEACLSRYPDGSHVRSLTRLRDSQW